MKRIFFIINCFSKGGGAESLLTSIVNNLNPQKYKIGIMEIIHDTVKEEPINNNVRMYPYYTKADAPDRKARMYYVYHEWDKVINEYIPDDYDIYISFNYLKPSFLLPQNKRCISWIHGDIYNLLEDKMSEERTLQGIAFQKADRIVAISDNTEKSIVEIYPQYLNKVCKIYNAVNADRIRSMSNDECEVVLGEKSIIAVGRLDENKNPIRLLRIFNNIAQKNREVQLYYLGWGVLEDEVKSMVDQLGLTDRVSFLGYYKNPYPIMKQASVMCMMSKSEGYSLAISESLALGVPVVSTRCGAAPRQIWCEDAGRVIETDEEAEEALLACIENELDIERKLNLFRKEKDYFTNYIDSIEEIIDEVILEGKC